MKGVEKKEGGVGVGILRGGGGGGGGQGGGVTKSKVTKNQEQRGLSLS